MIWVHLSFHIIILNSFYIGARHLNGHVFRFIFVEMRFPKVPTPSVSLVGSGIFFFFPSAITLFLHRTLYNIIIKYKSYVSTQTPEFWSAHTLLSGEVPTEEHCCRFQFRVASVAEISVMLSRWLSPHRAVWSPGKGHKLGTALTVEKCVFGRKEVE